MMLSIKVLSIKEIISTVFESLVVTAVTMIGVFILYSLGYLIMYLLLKI